MSDIRDIALGMLGGYLLHRSGQQQRAQTMQGPPPRDAYRVQNPQHLRGAGLDENAVRFLEGVVDRGAEILTRQVEGTIEVFISSAHNQFQRFVYENTGGLVTPPDAEEVESDRYVPDDDDVIIDARFEDNDGFSPSYVRRRPSRSRRRPQPYWEDDDGY